MSVVLEGFPNYIIFFDNQHIQKYVTSFSVSNSLGSNPAEASIQMLYTEAFMDIPYMTDVRIFVRNIFSSKYKMIFSGQLHGRQVAISGTNRQIIFTAKDYMAWMSRIPVPFLFGVEKSADRVECFSWLSKGVNFQKVSSIATAGAISFDNLNLEDTLKAMFDVINKSLEWHADSSEADDNSIYHWIDLANKLKVVSDIDAKLRQDSKLDIYYQGAIIENMYVLLTGIINQLGYEMYQDTDEIIKIKEPYWAEPVTRNHIIDPIIMLDFSEDTNWDNRYTRVLVTGGVESSISQNAENLETLHQFMPAGLYIGNTTDDFYVDLKQLWDSSLKDTTVSPNVKAVSSVTSGSTRNSVVSFAMSKLGCPYVWGAVGPYNYDCSGLCMWALQQAGYNTNYRTTFDMYPVSRKISLAQVQPGDLGFNRFNSKGPQHMGMYCGQYTKADGTTVHRWVQASSSKGQVVFNESASSKDPVGWQAYGDLISVLVGGFVGGGSIEIPTGVMQKPLTKLTDWERKYGINVFETQQPLIRMNNNSTTDNYDAVVPLIKQYSKYLFDTLNAGSVNASLTTIGAPWLRLGFNIWIDPNGLSRFYYINSIRHSGDANGVYTSLGLTYGRNDVEFTQSYEEHKNQKGTHTFTLDPKIKSSEYIGQTSFDGMTNIITPSDLNTFRTYLTKLADRYKDAGIIESYNSGYRDIYGQHYIRRNTEYLNRWDSEFNLAELYYIFQAYYSPKDTTIDLSAESSEWIGPVNPTSYSERTISDFARKVIDYDSKYIGPPQVVITRVADLAKTIKKAKEEINLRYTEFNPNVY